MDLWPCAVCWTLVVSVWLNLTSLTLTLRWGMRVLYSPFKNNCYGTSRCLAEFDFPDPHPQMRFAGITFTSLFLSYYLMFGQIWHSWHVLSGEGCRCCIHPFFFMAPVSIWLNLTLLTLTLRWGLWVSTSLFVMSLVSVWMNSNSLTVNKRVCVHVREKGAHSNTGRKSVCVCVWERDRERQRVREKDT